MAKPERKIDVLRTAFHKGERGGVGSVELRFSLIGDKGAVSFTILTGWHLPETYEMWKAKGIPARHENPGMGAGVVTHTFEQQFDWDSEPQNCDLLPGGKCYGDIGFLAADEFFNVLIRDGEEALWEKMQDWYDDLDKKEKE